VKSFKDSRGIEWKVAINVNSIARARDGVKFDLLSVMEDKNAIVRLSTDPMLLVGVLYDICQPQAETANISPEDFGEHLGDGDVIDAATTALLESLADFSRPHQRRAMMAALETLRKIETQTADLQIARIQSPEIATAILQAAQIAINGPLTASGNSAGNAPASSASTRDPSASAN